MPTKRDHGVSRLSLITTVIAVILVGGALAIVYQNQSMEISSLSSQKNTLAAQVSVLQSMQGEAQSTISQLQASLTSLSNSGAQDSAVIAQDTSEISSLQAQVAQEQSEIHMLQSQSTTTTTIPQSDQTLTLAENATSRVGTITGGPVSGCYASGSDLPEVSCTLPSIAPGDLIIAELDGVPETNIALSGGGASPIPPELNDSTHLNFTLIASIPLPTSTYVEYVFTATAQAGGPDEFSLSGQANYPSLIVHAFPKGDTVLGSSAGSSAGGGPSTTTGVTQFSRPAASIVISAVLTRMALTSATAGPGYQVLLNTAQGLTDEYGTPTGPNTAPFKLNPADNWTEISLVIATPATTSSS